MTEQVALITGGASGIGRATAERLIEAGYHVLIADIAANGVEVADEIGATFVYLDVSKPADWDNAMWEVLDQFGRLDLMHLNAGVQAVPIGVPIGDAPFKWVTPELYRRVTGINVEGVINGITAAKQLSDTQRPSDIVVTASIASLSALPMDPLYSMSKHAVIGFVRSIAPTLSALGIRIQSICPGGVDTPLPAPDLRIPGRVFAPPSHIAEAVMNALAVGAAGDIWMATDIGVPYWKYEFAPVR